MTPEDLEAKRTFIVAFFDELDTKIAFLEQLTENGNGDEARMLCVCYLDGLSNWLCHDSSQLARNFVHTLTSFSKETLFRVIVPAWLLKSLPWKSTSPSDESAVRATLGLLPPKSGLLPDAIESTVAAYLSEKQCSWLRDEMWRGTVAATVYTRVRSPSVHWLGSAYGITYSQTEFNGAPLRSIDFDILYGALKDIALHARLISVKTDKWFGIN
jgi:hypothetical protein